MTERGDYSVDTISKLQIEVDRWLALLKEKVSVEENINAVLQRPNQFKSNYGGMLIHLKPTLRQNKNSKTMCAQFLPRQVPPFRKSWMKITLWS